MKEGVAGEESRGMEQVEDGGGMEQVEGWSRWRMLEEVEGSGIGEGS